MSFGHLRQDPSNLVRGAYSVDNSMQSSDPGLSLKPPVRNRYNMGKNHLACFRCLLSESRFSVSSLLLAGSPPITLTIGALG